MALINGIEHDFYITIHDVKIAVCSANFSYVRNGEKDNEIMIQSADDTKVTQLTDLNAATLTSAINNLAFYNNNNVAVYTCSAPVKVNNVNMSLTAYSPDVPTPVWTI